MKQQALRLCGVDEYTVHHPRSGGKLVKKKAYILPTPDELDSPPRFGLDNVRLYNPAWKEPHSHKKNIDFIQAVIEAVAAVPASILLCLSCGIIKFIALMTLGTGYYWVQQGHYREHCHYVLP